MVFVKIIKWMMPLTVMVIAGLMLLGVSIPIWLAISVLVVPAILYTYALIVDKKHRTK